MPLIPFPIDQFGGLNLVVDPQDLGVSGATDLLNVDFDRPGALRTRWGSVKFNLTTLSSTGYQAVFPSPTNGGELLAVRGTGGTLNIDKVTSAGTTSNVGSFASLAFPLSTTALGTTTATAVYITFYDAATPASVTIRKYNGSTLASGTGKPLYAATSPLSNRLVQAGYVAGADAPAAPSDGSTANRSTVFFSDPGAPDTYPTSNFVHLRPGDGEVISAMVAWRDMLFVFKQSALFVFYSESTLSDGSPQFLYRRVDLPEPVADPLVVALAFKRYAIAGPDAVYYSTPRGIYRTTGGPPQLLSSDITPMFSSDTTNVSSSISAGVVPVSLSWVNDRLIGAYTNGASATRQIIWHQPTGKWSLWSLPGTSFTALPAEGTSALVRDFIFFQNGNDIWVNGPTGTTDGGSAIAWSYTTGYSSAGGYFRQRLVSSGERKKHFRTDILGSGTVTHQVLALNGRPNDVADPGASVTLGTAPTLARGSRRRGVRGSHFAHKLSGSVPAVVSGLTYWLSEVSMDT
jgi:hypothetical protein